MDLRLTGKIALVTGSTAGIGFAIAKSLATEGAHVYVNGRTQERVDAAVATIRSHAAAAKVEGIAADFSGSAGAEAVIAKLPAVDVLVNNVGIFEPKPFAEIPDADWYRLFEINVMSGVRLSRHYLAGMLKRNWGRILFISSESGVQIPAEMVHYGMTKTAQIAVARGIAESVAGTGVTARPEGRRGGSARQILRLGIRCYIGLAAICERPDDHIAAIIAPEALCYGG